MFSATIFYMMQKVFILYLNTHLQSTMHRSSSNLKLGTFCSLIQQNDLAPDKCTSARHVTKHNSVFQTPTDLGTGFLHFSTWCDCRFLSPQFIPIHTNPIPITLMIILKSFMALHRGSFLSLISLSSTGRSTISCYSRCKRWRCVPFATFSAAAVSTRYTGCYCCWCRCSTLCFYRFSTDSLHPPRARWKPSCLYKWKHFFTFPRWIFPEQCSSAPSPASTHPSTTSPGSGFHRWVFSPSTAPSHSFTHSWWLAPNPLCTFHWPNANKLTWII